MSAILTTAFFATYAAAQLTTSAWLPGSADFNDTLVASVVAQDGDHTTLALAFLDGPTQSDEIYPRAPPTVTIGGTTFVAYEVTAVDPLGESDNTVTVSLECTRSGASAAPTCTMSTKGADAVISELCAGLTAQSHATPTLTLSGDAEASLNDFQVIITAGVEKLDASAAATPTASGASVTRSSSGSSSVAAAGSGPSASGPSASAAASSSSVPQQSSNAAAPMRTIAPALAGLGAAVAYFL
ncbi:hypothetical protein BKA66DRAFT_405824 [Pyrenochaeta sp. MPI-SDFR-AT-0127]|nr:hypothetical protein BKA66DRAFT_405824 [Pyrenochaeta sp. MPI-SDFR-AT-0127]